MPANSRNVMYEMARIIDIEHERKLKWISRFVTAVHHVQHVIQQFAAAYNSDAADEKSACSSSSNA